jgi:hypothetical protein
MSYVSLQRAAKKVRQVFVTDIFDAKVVHAQVEPDVLWDVFLEARCMELFEVPMACKL